MLLTRLYGLQGWLADNWIGVKIDASGISFLKSNISRVSLFGFLSQKVTQRIF